MVDFFGCIHARKEPFFKNVKVTDHAVNLVVSSNKRKWRILKGSPRKV